MQRETIKVLAGATLSTAIAGTAGYYYAKKKLEKGFESLVQEEIAKAREYYALVNKADEFETPRGAVEKLVGPKAAKAVDVEVAVKAAAAATAVYQGQEVNIFRGQEGVAVKKTQEIEGDPEATVTVTATESQIKNVFADGVPVDPEDFDVDKELDERRNGVPHIVTFEEYNENDNLNEQAVLTYFEADDTLVDEDEKTIDDVEGLIGRANLYKFGHGSNDVNTVYVRNDMRGMDFEIVKNAGSYIENVLGMTRDETHLEHSATPRRKRVLSE